MSAKCPKCDQTIDSVEIENVTAVGSTNWRGIAYCCPHCNVAISIQIDPIAIRADEVSSIVDQVDAQIQHWGSALKKQIAALAEEVDRLRRKLH